jgi:hypothetical protein
MIPEVAFLVATERAAQAVFDETLQPVAVTACHRVGDKQCLPWGPDTSLLLDISQLIILLVHTQKNFVK